MPVRAVVVNLDGTLVDTALDIAATLHSPAERMGLRKRTCETSKSRSVAAPAALLRRRWARQMETVTAM